MKKLISVILLCAMLASTLVGCAGERGLLNLGDYATEYELSNTAYTDQKAWNGGSDTSWYSASGTEFTLTDGDDLKGFINLLYGSTPTDFTGKTVKLGNDINLGGRAWSIPTSTNYFKGTFDGQGHTIGNFQMSCTIGEQSLLGAIGDGATVKNLKIAKGVLTLRAEAATNYAAVVITKIHTVAGKTVTVSNVSVDKDSKITYVTDTKNYGIVAGIAANAVGAGTLVIENCSNAAPVNACGQIAGILGAVTNWTGKLTIKDCSNSGNLLLAKSNYAAGIVSNLDAKAGSEVVISGCTNSGSVTYGLEHGSNSSGGTWCAGIAGYWHGTIDSIVFENCSNTGDIVGANRASGGLIGFIQGAKALTVKNCSVDADMSFTYMDTKYPAFGGLVGVINMAESATNQNTVIENCSVKGSIHAFDPHDKPVFVGGLVGLLRKTELTVKGCTVNVKFSMERCEADDYAFVVLGGYVDGSSTSATPTLAPAGSSITVTDLIYISNDNVGVLDKSVDFGEVSFFKAVGQQYRKNSDGSYDIRYIFGIGNAQADEKYFGFDVTAKKLGKEVKVETATQNCTTVYKTIKGGSTTYKASDLGYSYFYTLTISSIPAEEIEFETVGAYTRAYVKNTILDVVPYAISADTKIKHAGYGFTGLTIEPKRFTFGYETFTPFLPDAFKGATGVLTSKNVVYPYGGATASNLTCQTYKQNGSNNQYMLQENCSHNGAFTCGWSATGAMAYKANTFDADTPYHYYIDVASYNKLYSTDIDRYEAYHTWSFEVAEDGYYEFCFRMRVNGSDGSMQTRYALVQIDDESYGSQTEFFYEVAAQDGVLRDNGTNHDSYVVGYGKYLTAGKHTITFRSPYDTEDESKGSSFHIRDIYMIKGNPLPVDADIPKLEGATLYDGNFDTAVTYLLNNTTKAVLDAYRAELEAAGFVLRDQRQTEYKFEKFDAANYKNDNLMHNDFYLYTNDAYMVYAYYTEGAKSIRVIVDTIEAYETYVASQESSFEAVTTPMFALLDIGGKDIVLTQGQNAGSKVTGVTNGMCLVFRLSDGRFIIVDGGFWNEKDTEGECVRRLYDWLQKNDHLEGENNKIVIANWIITHHHSDHISVEWKFDQMKKEGKFNAEVQNFMYNFPSYEFAMSVYGTNLKPSAYNMYYPNLHYMLHTNDTLVVHTGFTYQFADCSIEILYTHEDFYPERLTSYNNSSTVFKITLAGKTFLVAGDLEEPGQKRANKQAGTLLQADFLQVTHHGYNGQIEFYKYIVGTNASTNSGFNEDTIIIWPLPKGESASLFTGTSARGVANAWLASIFRKENDQANDNIHYAVENWVFTDFAKAS